MLDLSVLPAGCVLRPACRADRPQIRRLLAYLEQELFPGQHRCGRVGGMIAIAATLAIALSNLLFPGLHAWLLPGLHPAWAMGLSLMIYGLYGLIHQLQPMDDYWVVDCAGQLVACARLQSHKHYAILSDLYVVAPWRSQGVGSHLVTHVVTHVAQTAAVSLYLACLPVRQSFYARLGFVPVVPHRLSTLLRYDLGLSNDPGLIPLVSVPAIAGTLTQL